MKSKTRIIQRRIMKKIDLKKAKAMSDKMANKIAAELLKMGGKE